ATPFHASEHVLAQLAIPREDYAERIRIEYYEAGHMMYCHEPSRVAMSRHLEEFVAGAEPTAEAETEAGTAGTPDAEPGSPESDAEDAGSPWRGPGPQRGADPGRQRRGGLRRQRGAGPWCQVACARAATCPGRPGRRMARQGRWADR